MQYITRMQYHNAMSNAIFYSVLEAERRQTGIYGQEQFCEPGHVIENSKATHNWQQSAIGVTSSNIRNGTILIHQKVNQEIHVGLYIEESK